MSKYGVVNGQKQGRLGSDLGDVDPTIFSGQASKLGVGSHKQTLLLKVPIERTFPFAKAHLSVLGLLFLHDMV
jgi:hypothetical protein